MGIEQQRGADQPRTPTVPVDAVDTSDGTGRIEALKALVTSGVITGLLAACSAGAAPRTISDTTSVGTSINPTATLVTDAPTTTLGKPSNTRATVDGTSTTVSSTTSPATDAATTTAAATTDAATTTTAAAAVSAASELATTTSAVDQLAAVKQAAIDELQEVQALDFHGGFSSAAYTEQFNTLNADPAFATLLPTDQQVHVVAALTQRGIDDPAWLANDNIAAVAELADVLDPHAALERIANTQGRQLVRIWVGTNDSNSPVRVGTGLILPLPDGTFQVTACTTSSDRETRLFKVDTALKVADMPSIPSARDLTDKTDQVVIDASGHVDLSKMFLDVVPAADSLECTVDAAGNIDITDTSGGNAFGTSVDMPAPSKG